MVIAAHVDRPVKMSSLYMACEQMDHSKIDLKRERPDGMSVCPFMPYFLFYMPWYQCHGRATEHK
jgi:hypothetical protein